MTALPTLDVLEDSNQQLPVLQQTLSKTVITDEDNIYPSTKGVGDLKYDPIGRSSPELLSPESEEGQNGLALLQDAEYRRSIRGSVSLEQGKRYR